jgi:hypothetical protein
MIHRGFATFGLDWGKCPRWLFERMVALGRQIIFLMHEEYGPDEFIKRIADPVWFQSLGTVLAFDWNASGLTTILTAALKEAIRGSQKELGIFICGGKGKTSKKTPNEITQWGQLYLSQEQVDNLVYNSKIAAKVDGALIQDGFQIYHHSFFFSKNGHWAVIQQGMNTSVGQARRYHWYSEKITDLINEPHFGIVGASKVKVVALDLTSRVSSWNRQVSVELVQGGYSGLIKDLKILRKHFSSLAQVLVLKNKQQRLAFMNLEDREFDGHPVEGETFSLVLNNEIFGKCQKDGREFSFLFDTSSKYLEKILYKAVEAQPQNYEALLMLRGVGPKTIRALSLIAEVIYGALPSYEDPARYSFAHGGKDGTPYFVDREVYDFNIDFFSKLIQKLRLGAIEKKIMLAKLLR